MVSRRKILSRSRDDLTKEVDFIDNYKDDIWYSKEKLFKDHVEEVLRKWDAIDDEIWAKSIVMERNKRVAKAYARAPVLTINGGTGGFDGYRLGLNGFENPVRDPKTEQFKEHIGQGAKVKMDENGNILIKRLSKSGVYVKNSVEESAVSNDLLSLKDGLVDIEKPFRIFDMRKFQQNVNRELRKSNPDRTRLEHQCVTAISFVKNEPELLDSPVWVIIINIVALEMLKDKLPQVPVKTKPNIMSDPKRGFALSPSSDEDLQTKDSGHGSSGSSSKLNRNQHQINKQTVEGGKPGPGSPNKEKQAFASQNWSATSERKREKSRDDFIEDEQEVSTLKTRRNTRRRILKKTEEKKNLGEDPYYCGFSAKTPKYLQQLQNKIQQKQQQRNKELGDHNEVHSDKEKLSHSAPVRGDVKDYRNPKYRDPGVLGGPLMQQMPYGGGNQNIPNLAQIPPVQPLWWQSRLFPDPGTGANSHLSYQPQYYNGHLPFNYTSNEFSSFQFGRETGITPCTPVTKAKNGRKKVTGMTKKNIF